MPSFDIVSEVDKQEIDNALNQARKELATRFDLKDAKTEIIPEPDKIVLIADDGLDGLGGDRSHCCHRANIPRNSLSIGLPERDVS